MIKIFLTLINITMKKKIFFIIILLFFTVWTVFANWWLAWNWILWIAKPDDMNRLSQTMRVWKIEAYVDSYTWLKWEKFPWKDYGMKFEDAEIYCKSLWWEWRIPSLNELITISTYTEKNSNNANSIHPEIIRDDYLTSSKISWNKIIYFRFGSNISYTVELTSPKKIICVHN